MLTTPSEGKCCATSVISAGNFLRLFPQVECWRLLSSCSCELLPPALHWVRPISSQFLSSEWLLACCHAIGFFVFASECARAPGCFPHTTLLWGETSLRHCHCLSALSLSEALLTSVGQKWSCRMQKHNSQMWLPAFFLGLSLDLFFKAGYDCWEKTFT